jgi:hypothetical protein
MIFALAKNNQKDMISPHSTGNSYVKKGIVKFHAIFSFKKYCTIRELLAPEAEKIDMKNFFYDIKNSKEERCIQDKIYQKIRPAGDPCG